jgi:dTDP-4-dehydrorhamnose 3,5-epimerase
MHYQLPPHEEAKLVRCTQGAAHHVILDLRDNSETYLKWSSVDLNSDNRHLLYVPEGMAHGFITLADATEIFYQMSEYYSPESAAGVRWDDPAFSIAWPVEPAVISEHDRGYADYQVRT